MTTDRYSRSNLQSIVQPADGGDPFLDFLDGSYTSIGSALTKWRTHEVRAHDEYNLQIISDRYYGTVKLWWVIGTYNGIVNPLTELVAGTVLNIPTLESIEKYCRSSSATSAGVVSLP